MTEDQNPFIHPAQQRFQELLAEAEQVATTKAEETGTVADPLQNYHVAEGWGIDPWVACMYEVSQHLSVLQAMAMGIAPDPTIAKKALLAVAVGSLQALVLFEEAQSDGLILDDEQLASFLEKLVVQLDSRIEKLRHPLVQRAVREEDDHTDHVPFAWDPGGTVDDAVAAQTDEDEDDEDEDTGEWSADEKAEAESQVEEPSPEKAVHASPRAEPSTVWPEERGMAKELVKLRQASGGPTEPGVGGRHASPADTDPDVNGAGKH